MASIDIQQVCMNGHQMTDCAHQSPERMRDFCPSCGAKTVTACPSCEQPIPGHIHYERVVTAYSEDVPSFCTNCGNAYPWTEQKLEALQELTAEFDELGTEDQERLTSNMRVLVADSPKKDVATLRVKKILTKLSPDSQEALERTSKDLISKSLQRAIFGN